MNQHKILRFNDNNISFLVNKKALFIVAALILLTLVGIVVSTSLGDMYIAPLKVIKAIFGQGEAAHILVVRSFRLPRIITAVLAGGALALAGAILQGIIRNPLAAPNIIGITGGLLV